MTTTYIPGDIITFGDRTVFGLLENQSYAYNIFRYNSSADYYDDYVGSISIFYEG